MKLENRITLSAFFPFRKGSILPSMFPPTDSEVQQELRDKCVRLMPSTEANTVRVNTTHNHHHNHNCNNIRRSNNGNNNMNNDTSATCVDGLYM